MLSDIKTVLGDDGKRMYKPIILLSMDTLFNVMFFGMMYIVLRKMIHQTLTIENIQVYSLILIIAFILRVLVNTTGYTMIQCRGARIIEKSRITLGDHVRKLNLGFFNKNSIGTLTNIMTTDLQDFEKIITHNTSDLIKIVFISVYLISITFMIDLQLGLIQFGMVAAAMPIIFIGGKFVEGAGKKKKHVMNHMISRMVEYLSGIQVLKSHNMTGEKFERLEGAFKDFRRECIRTEVMSVPFILLFQVLVDLSFPLLLLVATYKYGSGMISKDVFLTFMVINISLVNILRGFGPLYGEFRYLKLSAARLREVYMNKPMSYLEEPATHSSPFKSYDICFENVHFEYEAEVPVIADLSFQAKEGEMTALIGPSGSGKTTVTSLVARFWDVNDGTIRIGGKDIRHVHPDVLMRYVSMVFQEVYLLNDTIYNNIAIGKPEASRDEVLQAARIANCHAFIDEMENGYETIIGEGGSTLSGGEKQRISIARALLKDAPIILLDEATASLDADNEYEIRSSIHKLTQRKTVVVIAHRLNTIRDADKIVVMKEGAVDESGTHMSLIKKQGTYYKMITEMERAKEWAI